MTEPSNPSTPDEPTPDETFTWTNEGGPSDDASRGSGDAGAAGHGGTASSASTTATAILESLREAVDDLAERADPDGPRVLGSRGRAGRGRRGSGRAARPPGRRGDLRRQRQARHQVAHLGGGPPRVDLAGRGAGGGRRRPCPDDAHPAGRTGCRDGPDRRLESGLISHAILRA